MALSSTWLSQCQYGQLHASVPSHRWYSKLSHNGHNLLHTAAAEYGTLSHICGHFLQLCRLLRSLQVYWLHGILQDMYFAMVPVGACTVAYDLPMPSNTGTLAAGIGLHTTVLLHPRISQVAMCVAQHINVNKRPTGMGLQGCLIWDTGLSAACSACGAAFNNHTCWQQ